jgi:MFS family permease
LPKELRKPLRRASDALHDAAPAADALPDAAPAAAPGRTVLAGLRDNPVLLGLVTASLFVAVAAGAMQSVFQFWGRDLFNYSLRDIGLHFMVFALFSAAGQAGLVGPLVKRFGAQRVSLGSIVGVACGLLLFAVAQNDAMVWAAICIFGLANGLFLPAITSLVSFEADAGSRGAVMGMFNASSSAGRIVGPALSGPIYFKLGPAAPFVISALLAILGALFLSRVRARDGR